MTVKSNGGRERELGLRLSGDFVFISHQVRNGVLIRTRHQGLKEHSL
jgi:hypothetical protein